MPDLTRQENARALMALVRSEDESDRNLLDIARYLITQGIDLALHDSHPVHPYSLLDWAASNTYDATLLVLAEALVADPSVSGRDKRIMLEQAFEYSCSPTNNVYEALLAKYECATLLEAGEQAKLPPVPDSGFFGPDPKP